MVLLCGRGFESLQLHSINSIALADYYAGVMLFLCLGVKKWATMTTRSVFLLIFAMLS